MSTLNWGRLVAQNRAKAIGVPWTDEETHEIFKEGANPEDVRDRWRKGLSPKKPIRTGPFAKASGDKAEIKEAVDDEELSSSLAQESGEANNAVEIKEAVDDEAGTKKPKKKSTKKTSKK